MVFALHLGTAVCAAPQPVDRIRHEVNNHSSELRMMAERLNTQEELIQALREDVRRMTQESQELVKSGSNANQMRLADLENNAQTLIELLTSCREGLNKCQGRLDSLEASLSQQCKNHQTLEKTLALLIEAVETDPSSHLSGGDSASALYRVTAGDSLDKIARKLKTTVRALKELNSLDNDLIMVGQKLKIPKPS